MITIAHPEQSSGELIKMTLTFVCLFYDVGTTPLCPGCGVRTKLRLHNFVVVPRFTTRDMTGITIYNFQRVVTPKAGNSELWFLCSAYHMVIYISSSVITDNDQS